VNVIVVAGDQGLRAAKEATATIPIVALICDKPDHVMVSIARPGLPKPTGGQNLARRGGPTRPGSTKCKISSTHIFFLLMGHQAVLAMLILWVELPPRSPTTIRG
jgi:hypothetical protein